MGIKHAFVSTVPDAGNTSFVRPSNWNEDHTIDNGTITDAQINDAANISESKLNIVGAIKNTGAIPFTGAVSGTSFWGSGTISAAGLSATTYYNLPSTVASATSSTQSLCSTNSSLLQGLSASQLTGGGVGGADPATAYAGSVLSATSLSSTGLTAGTISATTYNNLPNSIASATSATQSLCAVNSGLLNGVLASALTSSPYVLPEPLVRTTMSATTFSGGYAKLDTISATTYNNLPTSIASATSATQSLCAVNSGLLNGVLASSLTAAPYSLPEPLVRTMMSATTFSGGDAKLSTISATTYNNLPATIASATSATQSLCAVNSGLLNGVLASSLTAAPYTLPEPLVRTLMSASTFSGGYAKLDTVSATTYTNLPNVIASATSATQALCAANSSLVGGSAESVFLLVSGTRAATDTLTSSRFWGSTGMSAVTLSGTSIYGVTLSATTVSAATISGGYAKLDTVSATTYVNLPAGGTGDIKSDGSVAFTSPVTGTIFWGSTAISAVGLSSTSVKSVTITATTLSGTDLSGTNVKVTTVSATTVSGTDLSGTNVKATTITGTTVSATDLSSTNVKATTVTGTTLSATTFSGTTINATNHYGTTMSATTFSGTNSYVTTVTGTNVNASVVTATSMTGATTVQGTNVNATTVTATNVTGATWMVSTNFSGSTATSGYATTFTAKTTAAGKKWNGGGNGTTFSADTMLRFTNPSGISYWVPAFSAVVSG